MAKASLLDDSYWRSVQINSVNGTVCSYELLNEDQDSAQNVFEIQIAGLKNAQIGLYYGQYNDSGSLDAEYFDVSMVRGGASSSILKEQLSDYKRLIDMKIFDSNDCADLLHCTVSSTDADIEDRYIQLMLSKA